MQRLEVSGAVQPIYGSLGVKRLKINKTYFSILLFNIMITYLEYTQKYLFFPNSEFLIIFSAVIISKVAGPPKHCVMVTKKAIILHLYFLL